MIKLLDHDDAAHRPLPEDSHDPWADWKPQWSKGRAKTPHDFQERHAPTRAVEIKVTHERSIRQARQRLLEARLWDGLAPVLQDAVIEIERAFSLMSKPVGYHVSNFSTPRVDQCRADLTGLFAAISKSYMTWATDCQRARLSHAAALDIIAFGQSCRAVDRARRMKNGWARENLGLCLALWCKMRGWPEG